MKFDEELLLSNIETILKNNFNNKVTAINTEKNDTITLAQINSNAYAMDLDDKIVNHDPFILYMTSDSLSEARGPVTSQHLTITIALFLSDNGNDHNIVKRLLRYRRCLQEVIQDNFRKINLCDEVTIESLPIMPFQKSSNSILTKVVGINLITTITT